MKKEYRKPTCYVEPFQLANHISAGCGMITNFGNTCPFTEGKITFFTNVTTCSEDAVSVFEFAGVNPDSATVEDLINKVAPICYNSPADFTKLFAS